MLSYPGGDLPFRQLVDSLNAHDPPPKIFTLQAFGKLAFSLAGAEDQNGVSLAHGCDHLLKECVEMVGKATIPHVLGRALLGAAGESNMLLHAGVDALDGLGFAGERHDGGLPVVS